MTDYHTTYKGPEGETTKWDDIQVKLGNKAPKAPVWKPDAYEPEAERKKDAAWVEGKGAEELEEGEDDRAFTDDRFMAEYRRKRLEELRQGAARPRFGGLEQIRQSEFVAEVTNAPAGVWVVCHLYKDSVQDCAILNQCLEEVAKTYPNTKFVKIVSTECIPGYPDQNLPTALLYRDTKCVQTMVGLRHFGGRSTSPELVAISLNRHGDVCGDAADHEGQVRGLIQRLLLQRAEEQQQGGGGSSAAAAAQQQQAEDDEDSDFD
ncbi:hypothetical protein ABPG75_010450 [Micractinium tetrahymenae]